MFVDDSPAARNSPLNDTRSDRAPQPGIGLCLSGGGYRAMVFHAGVLWRLYDSGILKTVNRVSSVSGGSIAAGVLALAWSRLSFDSAKTDFADLVVGPLRRLAGKTIDIGAVVGGMLLPGTIAERVASAYRSNLFGDATLQSLPDRPRFVINATNVQSGALWRFSKPYMGDYRVGRVMNPVIPLATAVAASSAFPPFLSPMTIELDPKSFAPNSGDDLQQDPYLRRVVLSDGGVYDNLGLETVWKEFDTILVSDGGAKMPPEPQPKGDWARHAYRVFDLVDNQVRGLRKRGVIGSFKDKTRKGAYWSIRTDISEYPAPGALPCPAQRTMALAGIPTRLASMEPDVQVRLINWGYAVCDAALRSFHDPGLKAPGNFPYPNAGV